MQLIVWKLEGAPTHCQRTVKQQIVALEVRSWLKSIYLSSEGEGVVVGGVGREGIGDVVDVVVEELEGGSTDWRAEGELEEEGVIWKEGERGSEGVDWS